MKKRIFSGAQPTGELHIGNYLGALKNWVALQDDYENFFCIVNLHAITLPQDPKILRRKTLDLAKIYLAAGIDPEKSTVFVQSDVSEHAELAWVLNCVARMGELERMTQFKEKSRFTDSASESYSFWNQFSKSDLRRMLGEKETSVKDTSKKDRQKIFQAIVEGSKKHELRQVERATVGLFDYPVLMASDILLYQTDLVPVGQDQKQHLELTRDLATRFNRDFGETFVVPEPYIPPVGAKILSLKDPAQKMSKSDENTQASIFLMDDADTIRHKIKKAVTDSGAEIAFDESRPAITNLLTIYQLMSDKTAEECEAHFKGKGYGALKKELAEVIVEYLKPFQKRVKAFDDEELSGILRKGAEKARLVAAKTLKDVYEKMGIN